MLCTVRTYCLYCSVYCTVQYSVVLWCTYHSTMHTALLVRTYSIYYEKQLLVLYSTVQLTTFLVDSKIVRIHTNYVWILYSQYGRCVQYVGYSEV